MNILQVQLYSNNSTLFKMSQNRTVTIVQPDVLQTRQQNVIHRNTNEGYHDASYHEEEDVCIQSSVSVV